MRSRRALTAVTSLLRLVPCRFDCFSIDEHASQAQPPEWWSTTFKARHLAHALPPPAPLAPPSRLRRQESIRDVGHTLMVLSPWDRPIPLTRHPIPG